VAIGDQSNSRGETKSDSNTFIGAKAGYSLVKGSRNTSMGIASMVCSVAGAKDLYDNIAIGYNTMNESDSAKRNTIIGNWAGTEVGKGTDNVAVGYSALYNSWAGNKSTAVGAYALGMTEWKHEANTAIGYWAGHYTNSDSSIYIGFKAGASDSTYHNTSGKLFIDNQDRDSLNTFIYGSIPDNLLRLNSNVITKSTTVTDTATGMILTDKNGGQWRLRVSVTGVLTAQPITP
jgi:hypothetical protein